MIKILVTGSNGLLGHKLIEILQSDQEVDLLATSRGKSRLPKTWQFNYMPMDITRMEEVKTVFDSFNPDVVINTAAMTQVDDCETNRELCYDLNVNAVKNLIEACKHYNAFILHLSTDFIFKGDKGPLKENEEPAPVNYYGETKLESEAVVMESGLPYAIARTVLVYGVTPNMSRSNIILWVKQSLEQGKEIKVVNDQFRTPTLAEDLAKGCIAIAKRKKQGIYNISGKDFLTPYEMAIKTADFFNLDKSLITETDSTKFTQPAKRPLKTGFDITKAQTDLDYRPVSFSEGIEIVAKQFV